MAAPIQSVEMTKFPKGVSSFGMPVLGGKRETTGRVFFVDSTSGNNGNDASHGSDPFTPFATLAYALGQAGADRGDIIYVLSGHVESLTGAAALNFSVAGVSVVGLGPTRPVFNFSTSTAASVTITAANCYLENVEFDCTGIATQVVAISVTAANFTIVGCQFNLGDASGYCLSAIKTDGNGDRLRIIACDFLADDTNAIGAIINIFGSGGTVIENVEIAGCRFVADTNTGGAIYASGVVQNLYVHDNTIDTLGSNDVAIRIAQNGSGIFVRNYILGTSLTAILDLDISATGFSWVENYGYDKDTAGSSPQLLPLIGTAVPTEKSLVDLIMAGEFAYYFPNRLTITADMSNAQWNTVATHEILTVTGTVRVIIIPVCTTNLTDGGGGTIQLGLAGATSAFIAATTAADIDASELWLGTTPAASFARSSVIDRIVTGGVDIGYEIAVAALTGGALSFYCWWAPISSDGDVTTATGGSL